MELALFLSPIAVLAAINAIAWLRGERDTLLLPGFARYPAVDCKRVEAVPAPAAVDVANDAEERLAA